MPQPTTNLAKYRVSVEEYDPAAPAEPRKKIDKNQEETLLGLVKRLYDRSCRNETIPFHDQRRFQRLPFHRVVTLTPCPTLEEPRLHEAEPVVAKDISSGGLCFVHHRRPTEKQILITLGEENLIPICMLAEVRYVVPTQQAMYVIGVEFKQRVQLSLEEALE
ncbi:PilZ domain-containing protein [bacterium]|jgi:hypothetical protein|nr:PilZ domain-containing protein [bacterium]